MLPACHLSTLTPNKFKIKKNKKKSRVVKASKKRTGNTRIINNILRYIVSTLVGVAIFLLVLGFFGVGPIRIPGFSLADVLDSDGLDAMLSSIDSRRPLLSKVDSKKPLITKINSSTRPPTEIGSGNDKNEKPSSEYKSQIKDKPEATDVLERTDKPEAKPINKYELCKKMFVKLRMLRDKGAMMTYWDRGLVRDLLKRIVKLGCLLVLGKSSEKKTKTEHR